MIARSRVWSVLAPMFSLVGFLAAGSAAADPRVCTVPIEGRWTIISFTSAPVSAVSWDEARRKVGRKVVISKDVVTFPPDVCRVTRVSRKFASADDVSMFPDDALNPLEIAYDCSDKAYIPSFNVGKSCAYIYSTLDGIKYKMRRDK